MHQISLAQWLMGCGQLVPGEVPENGTWWIREEQHISLKSSSSPCAAAMHKLRFPISAGAAAERKTFWLVDRLIYADCFYQQLLLKSVLRIVDTTLFVLFISWLSGDTCSCAAMAMEEEFRPKLTVMSLTSYSLPHPEEIPKLFWCSSLKLSLVVHFLNPPEGDKILFHLISILSLLAM